MATRKPKKIEYSLETASLLLAEGIDMHRNTLLLMQAINIQALRKVLKFFMLMDGKDCTIVLNSGGGSVVQGLAILDAFKEYKGHLTVKVQGRAESMAAILLQAANHRQITASSNLMLHQGEEVESGHKQSMRSAMKVIDHRDLICDTLVLDRMNTSLDNKITLKEFYEMMKTDKYYTAREAWSNGLVDEVIED